MVSDGNKDYTCSWTRYTLAENLSTFHSCPETLRRLREGDNLAENISRQFNFQAVARVRLAGFSQTYSEYQKQIAELSEKFSVFKKEASLKEDKGQHGC